MISEAERRRVLALAGASATELEELLEYNGNRFDLSALPSLARLPLPDEPHVEAWRNYQRQAPAGGLLPILRDSLVPLWFPIGTGISESAAYRRVVRQGEPPTGVPEAVGLSLENPEGLRLDIHPTPAGHIPILTAGNRTDFVALVRALLHRNEPAPVPDSMGAVMVAGFNNWGRIRSYRQAWERDAGETRDSWAAEFERLRTRKELYQDRFILLSSGPYSNTTAADLGLEETRWLELSWIVRREHEVTHYFTRRVLGSMRNNLLDELLADYMGIRAAAGHFRADWFLRFMGLEPDGAPRPAGRLANYRGHPPLSDGAFRLLANLVRRAATHLARFDEQCLASTHSPIAATAALVALAHGTMEAFAAEDGVDRLAHTFRSLFDAASARL